MPRIVTITLSPCIDKSTSVPELVAEKKLTCGYTKTEPGGGGINVARVLRRLGGDVLAIYPAGGYSGKYFTALLEQDNLPAIVIETAGETRENIIVLDQSSNRQYRFGMPAGPLTKPECEKMLAALEKINAVEFIVVSGSLPPGLEPGIIKDIAAIGRGKDARLIVDTSGDALRCAADEGAWLIKPNLGELCFLAGKNYLEGKEIAASARDLLGKGKCKAVVVSLGAEGALLVTGEIEKKISAPVVPLRSTVGAGDSMVAGIVYALSKAEDLPLAVQYGVACGTAATLNSGTALCKPSDVQKLFKLILNKREERFD